MAWDELYDKVTDAFPEIEAISADSANKTPHICKKAFDDGRVLSTAYKRQQTMKRGHKWWKYVYDEYYDRIICPEYQILCTRAKACVKTARRHIWKEYLYLADDARYTPEHAELYRRRKETIERVFADAKEQHAMRYTQHRCLARATNWVRLKYAAMNLKKLATWA